MSERKSWLESLDKPVLEIRPYAANRNAETKDAPMIEVLKAERDRLEVRYSAERSLLDRLIDRLTPKEAVAPPPNGEPLQKPHPALPPLVKPSEPGRRRKPAALAGASESSSGTDKVRSYIAHHPEIRVKEMTRDLGISHSASSCAVQKLAAQGQIERVGFGRYRRTPAFRPSESNVSEEYAKFRQTVQTNPAES